MGPPLFLLPVLIWLASSARAVLIPFSNCLSSNIQQNRNPYLALQFQPFFVDAKFDTSSPAHNLTLTVYGNVTGQTTPGAYPPPADPSWQDPTNPFGQILNVTQSITTLFTTIGFLTYNPYIASPSAFCNAAVSGPCPFGPLFGADPTRPDQLHAFRISHAFDGPYSLATLSATLRIQNGYGGTTAQYLGCVLANVTPDLGASLSAALLWIPIVILALVGLATLMAAKYGPSSSKNFFYWSSYYGRDDDMLRLVTPGFADCLQYIQFIVLTGGLSLSYPGFYQPVVSRAGWSTLTFNQSFVSHGPGQQPLVDGVYFVNGTYGLSNLRDLAGMTTDSDMWGGMAVWLCVILISVIFLCQAGFFANWAIRRLKKSPPEDLRSKNLPFTAGNVTRIVYNFFLLPIVSLSMFQLVVAGQSPGSVVALAVVLLVSIAAFAAWTFFLIFTTNPRTALFDHLPSLLLYGPLYNTYSDEAAPFAIVPAVLNFVRGIAIGAVQPAGVVQLVILAICEIVFILTIHAFRPFQGLTSMNAYHTFFSVIRLITVLMMVAFVSALGVDEGVKGWIGYAVFLLHAVVLILGFFLNAIQTLIEIFARMAGVVGSRKGGGLARVFGVRQLSKRGDRPHHDSLGSSAAMLDAEYKPRHASRLTSMSGGSAPGRGRQFSFDTGSGATSAAGGQYVGSQGEEDGATPGGPSPGPSTPGGQPASFMHAEGAAGHNRRPSAPAVYYRTPRQRRPTFEALGEATGEREHVRRASADAAVEGAAAAAAASPPAFPAEVLAAAEQARHSMLSPNSFLRDPVRDPAGGAAAGGGADAADAEARRKQAEYYMSRESDFLYGVVRGPALSSEVGASTARVPRRRRVTGPADPISPAAAATGWLRGFFTGAGRRKDTAKGFEVVRSRPLHLMPGSDEEAALAGAANGGSPPQPQPPEEPYLDSPPKGQRRGAVMEMVDAKAMRHGGAPLLRPISTGPALLLPARLGEEPAQAVSPVQAPPTPLQSHTRAPSGGHGHYTPPGMYNRTAPPRPRRPDEPPVEERSDSLGSSVYPEEPPDFAEVEQRMSTGRVAGRTAGEAIRRYDVEAARMMGSAAELVVLRRRA